MIILRHAYALYVLYMSKPEPYFRPACRVAGELPTYPVIITHTRVQGKEIASLVEIDHWQARVVSIQIYTNHCICSAYGTSTSRIRLSQSTALAISFPCTRVHLAQCVNAAAETH